MPEPITGFDNKETLHEGEGPPGITAVKKVPALTIVSHPSMARAGERAVMEGRELGVSRAAPEFSRRGRASRRPLEDQYLSRKPFVLSLMDGGGVRLRLGEHGTSVSVAGQALSGEVVIPPEQLARGVPIVLCKRIVLLLHLVESGRDWPDDDLGMMGESAAIHQVRQRIRNVVDLATPVLIRGENGTGKERVAQALHERSKRRGQFIAHNLAAIPEGLAAAELFGAKKGAYADLKMDRKGLFREAHGGTLFLDEVGDALPQVQAILLRALETGEITPLGTAEQVKVDVRLIAATDIDIEARSKTGQFRAPLLYRLAGYEIHVPPLRDRPEDIGLLFAHFAKLELEATGETSRLEAQKPEAAPWLPADLAVLLLEYEWPGNVRELRNVTRQLVINHRGEAVLTADERLRDKLRSKKTQPAEVKPPEPGAQERPEYSADQLREALFACDFEIAAAAERLGMKRPTFQYWLKRYGIRTIADLSPEEIKLAYEECGRDLEQTWRRLEVSRRALKPVLRTLGLESGD